jgi:hypothetical protein
MDKSFKLTKSKTWKIKLKIWDECNQLIFKLKYCHDSTLTIWEQSNQNLAKYFLKVQIKFNFVLPIQLHQIR